MTQLVIKYANIALTLLFLQDHRETDRIFPVSGVQLEETDRGQFHFHRVDFSSHLKRRVGLTLTKSVFLCITLNLDGAPITSKSHTQPITLTNISSINLVFQVSTFVRCSSSPIRCSSSCVPPLQFSTETTGV